MDTTRRNFIKLSLAGIVALFAARFSKPAPVAKAVSGGDALPENWDVICNYNYESFKSAFGPKDADGAPLRLQREGVVSSEEYPTVGIVWNMPYSPINEDCFELELLLRCQ